MVTPKQLANLKPFRKGENSKSRGHKQPGPKNISTLARELLDDPCPARPGLTYREAIARVLLDQAAAGEVRFVSELLDRLEGRVPQVLSGEGGGPILIKEVRIHAPEGP
jgi:hypothetical protein